MEQFERIRHDHRDEGLSIRALAVPRPRRTTVRTAPVLGVHERTVRRWLTEDMSAPRKQRHTARRVWDYMSGKNALTPGLPFEQLGLGNLVWAFARATPVKCSNPVPLQRICPFIVTSKLLTLLQTRPSHVTPGAGVVLGDAMALPGTKVLEVAISAATRTPRPRAR